MVNKKYYEIVRNNPHKETAKPKETDEEVRNRFKNAFKE
jgi:hypothetical protein